MPRALAYFLSWTTKGSWLPGDERGWVDGNNPAAEILPPDPDRAEDARLRMSHDAIVLGPAQRQIVTQTIQDHCRIRNWTLHAVNARTNHVHVVVEAGGYSPEEAMNQFKAWCSRRLNERAKSLVPAASSSKQHKWWTEHGSTKWINDQVYLHRAINYVLDKQ